MKLLVIVSVLLFINCANTLNCYYCAGTQTSDCATAKKSSMTIQPCVIPPTEHTHDKVKHVLHNSTTSRDQQYACFRYSINGYEPSLMGRSCGVVPKDVVEPCTYLMKKFKVVKDCSFCKTNLCNHDTKVAKANKA